MNIRTRLTDRVIGAVIIVACVAALGAGLGYFGDTEEPRPAAAAPAVSDVPRPTPTATPEPAPEPVTFAAVGDSITAWIDRAGVPQPNTWVSFVGPEVEFTGEGWAKGGANLAEMQANTVPVSADVLVVMAGTNDLGDAYGTPMGARLASVDMIVATANPARAIIVAVPPLEMAPQWSNDWNATLLEFAASRGWQWVDPWVTVRAADGHWTPGASSDGIHPTPDVQRVAAAAFTAAIAAH